jgi:hypothetical protein
MGGLHPELATIVDRSGTSAENAQKGDSPEDSSVPHWNLALSVKVTSGGLSAPISRWKVGCHLLWIDGSWDYLSRLHFLASGSHSSREVKGHLPPRQWSLFLCLTILSWSLVQ